MSKHYNRKINRQAQIKTNRYRKLSKTAAVMGTTVTAVSVAAPMIPTTQVQADNIAQYSSTSSQQQFINQIAPYAQSVASANDLYASVMMAQAILESAWGQSALAQAPNYNLFGIKGSYNGQTVYMNTLEFLNGQWVTKNEPFRRYPSYGESFADNARTLKTVSFQSGVYYYAGAWKSNTTSYRDATAWLTGRYATDPNYASSLNRIIETYGLTQYDTPASGNATITPGSATTGGSGSVASYSTYTVVSGDTLWVIANRFGVSIAQLKSWNGLAGDTIYVGQKLTIQTGTGNTAVSVPTTPTPAPSITTPSSTSGQTYTVVAGDSVWKIANQFGISMDNLRSWNNIQNNLIYPGQVLKVSQSTTTTPSVSTPSTTPTKPAPSQVATSPSTSTASYTVKAGDSLWAIATKHGLSVAQLKSMNSLSSDVIYPGQQLKVSATSNATTTTPSQGTNTPTTSASSQTASTPSSTSTTSYTVKAGDSLWAIATKHGLSVAQLKSMNGLSSDVIYPGQQLKVSKTASTTAATPTPVTNKATTTASAPSQTASTPSSASTASYTVKAGDSLWAIATKHGLSVAQLKALNHLSSDLIFVNQTLKLK
ncbi:LysM peptidoglycan-binding domain-containing protein [Enterococcus columbae]|uniref:Peptidoglycan hydrolase n=1 Tax=Enterococcus columbae DSM 7374 = ATCC 51263 TaxID=1121865 RepID=S0KMK1_9ENTE|nr:LysM peptidoglycan-binding domain-containing protein [Enterococcus columbae]EOT40401.1 hypothetical protein OMW_01515 [Enterococcus columbae DSM 7374 = ATCC 51263]EOW80427.1 hypothetical protein I568_02130 [Enterococcus columbae DSM 7374 = ATCC 51263]